MKTFIFTLFAALVFVSCAESGPKNKLTPEQIEVKKAMYGEVMKVHDEAMVWMDEMHALENSLELAKDSITNDSIVLEVNNAIQGLDEAGESMMRWMRDFKEPADTGNFQHIQGYLNNEGRKIAKVGEEMKASMEVAKKLLTK